MYVDSVLKRDAAKTDYVVLPFAGAVLANLVLATASVDADDGTPDEELRELSTEARAILESALEQHDDAWTASAEPYARVRDFVIDAWPLFYAWTPFTYALHKCADPPALGGPTHLGGALTWLRTHRDASLLDSMFVAAFALDDIERKADECPLLSRAARPGQG